MGDPDQQTPIIAVRQQMKEGWDSALSILLDIRKTTPSLTVNDLRRARSRLASSADSLVGPSRAVFTSIVSRIDGAFRRNEAPERALDNTIALAQQGAARVRAHLRAATPPSDAR